MSDRPAIVLARVLRVLRPLVRLLVRNGVTYTALAAALKPVFVAAAREELQRQAMPTTDSALTLLSGVHRRDLRSLRASPSADVQAASGTQPPRPLSLAAEVVARWLNEPLFLDDQSRPRPLSRGGDPADPAGFDALVAGVSSDVRARAVLDELLRLGVVHEQGECVHLHPGGFAPQQGFEELAWLFADNLHDHAAAAAANLQGQGNFLEQAVFVDRLTDASVDTLQRAAGQAWQQAMREVLHTAQERFDADAAHAPQDQRRHRARFGVYFFTEPEAPTGALPAAAPPASPASPADANANATPPAAATPAPGASDASALAPAAAPAPLSAPAPSTQGPETPS
jgi:hypothetical protein